MEFPHGLAVLLAYGEVRLPHDPGVLRRSQETGLIEYVAPDGSVWPWTPDEAAIFSAELELVKAPEVPVVIEPGAPPWAFARLYRGTAVALETPIGALPITVRAAFAGPTGQFLTARVEALAPLGPVLVIRLPDGSRRIWRPNPAHLTLAQYRAL